MPFTNFIYVKLNRAWLDPIRSSASISPVYSVALAIRFRDPRDLMHSATNRAARFPQIGPERFTEEGEFPME